MISLVKQSALRVYTNSQGLISFAYLRIKKERAKMFIIEIIEVSRDLPLFLPPPYLLSSGDS